MSWHRDLIDQSLPGDREQSAARLLLTVGVLEDWLQTLQINENAVRGERIRFQMPGFVGPGRSQSQIA